MCDLEENSRDEVVVLGRVVGSCVGCDAVEDMVTVYFDFEPVEGVKLPSGSVTVDYDSGVVSSYDDDGFEIEVVDLVNAIYKLPAIPLDVTLDS